MANPTYALGLYQSQAQDAAFVEDLTHRVDNWNRATRWNGGYWMGSFTVKGDLVELQDWFYNRLGYHVSERAAGAVTWEGLIYEMELSAGNGVRRRRSLDDVYNAVRTYYADADGEVDITDWSTQAQSIARYGRREDTLSGTYVSAENAAEMVTRRLAETAWPWARCTGIQQSTRREEAALEVTVAGYAWTLNWRFMPDTWSSDDQVEDDVKVKVSDWFATVFGDATLCPYINLGSIATNTIEVPQYLAEPIRVWDWAQELLRRGFGAGITPARLWVSRGRYLNYAELVTTPSYYLQGGRLLTTISGRTETNPWTVTPGVVRDIEYPRVMAEPGSILADVRDILVEEVHVGADGSISLRTQDASLADLWSSFSLGWRSDMQRMYDALEQSAAESRRRAAEAWEEDYNKRKTAYETANRGSVFTGREDMPWLPRL